MQVARRACVQYGKGHPSAAPHFGGAFAYALAKERDEPLLFKSDDLIHMDVRRDVRRDVWDACQPVTERTRPAPPVTPLRVPLP